MTIGTKKNINVTKRDGSLEPLNLDKFHKVVHMACEDLSGVSPSEVEINSQIKFYDGIRTSDVQETLIRAAAELISEDHPNYQYVASRLINYHLRKGIYGSTTPTTLHDQIQYGVDVGLYDPCLMQWYTPEEMRELDVYIKHDRDYDIVFAGMEQFRGKYLIRNRYTKKIIETPQFAYMLIAMSLFHAEKTNRLKWVKEYYDAISTFDISLPTPIMAGVRTPQRQFSSCVLVESDDSLDSIFATTHAIGKYVANKAGIGIGAGRIRSVGSPIRNGDAVSTGVIPFYRLFQSAIHSCSQGSVRGGAGTLHYTIFHPEVEDLLVLKNNKGTEFNRLRHMDYSVQINKLFYKRLIEGGVISLIDPNDVPGLYDAFFADQELFESLYTKAEKDKSIRKKVVPALQIFASLMQERKDTGRIYIMNVDNVNRQGSFRPEVAPVHMSNLCQEIVLPVVPMSSISDEKSMIALCILSAINWGKIKKPEDFERPCRLAVRALDNLIDFQSYPLKAGERFARNHRSLGVGIINFAYWLAKNDLNYQDIDEHGLAIIDSFIEAQSYYLTKASVDIAEERGPAEFFSHTKYSKGEFVHENRAIAVDELVPHRPKMDWETLRERMMTYGIRNTALSALMPSETSSILANATNGIEPPRALTSIKQSKDGISAQVVPEVKRLKNKYDLLWNQKSPVGYLKIMAVLQKWVDQSISTNTSYNPKFYEDGLMMSELLQHLLLTYKWGLKTLYYMNINDAAGELELSAPGESHEDEVACEACVI